MELSAELARELREISSYELYADLELPLVTVLAEMEHTGIAVDLDVLNGQRKEFALKVEQVESE